MRCLTSLPLFAAAIATVWGWDSGDSLASLRARHYPSRRSLDGLYRRGDGNPSFARRQTSSLYERDYQQPTIGRRDYLDLYERDDESWMFEARDVVGMYERDYEGFAFEPRDILAKRAGGKTTAPAAGTKAGKMRKTKKVCKLRKRAPTSTKVPMGKTQDEELCQGDSYYCDDLTGCTAVVVRWAENEGYYPVVFSHVNPASAATMAPGIKTAIEGVKGIFGAATGATLVKSKKSGAEQHPTENTILKTMLTGLGLSVTERTYENKGSNSRVEYRAGDNDVIIA